MRTSHVAAAMLLCCLSTTVAFAQPSPPPDPDKYDLVVVNYYNRGAKDRWGARTEAALQDFVRAGKGLILYHLALGAFDGWVDYEKMSGGRV